LARIERQVREYDWPPVPAGADWAMGVDPAALRALVAHWTHRFDWRAEEAQLDRLSHHLATVDGEDLHFVRHPARGTSGAALPIVLLHGWPGSFLEYLAVADRLAAGGEVGEVIVVSLPGTGYSAVPRTLLGPREIARRVHRLMTRLGHDRYVAHGADWGALVSGWLGFDQPGSCAGIHMTMASPRFIAAKVGTEPEQQWLAGFRERFEDDGAYFRLQTSRPSTAGHLLGDNPVGLLAWVAEKFAAWSDLGGQDRTAWLTSPSVAHALLRNVMQALVTGTAASSIWIYRGLAVEGPPGYPDGRRVEVPVAFAATRDPVFVPPPRSLLEKVYRIERWTDYPSGGHFPGFEVPDLLARDLAEFAASLSLAGGSTGGGRAGA
jgi:pimeloyl-ACP methyl ester carboxylesterase